MRKPKPRSKQSFAMIHLAVIHVVVEAGKMEEPMQHENLDLSQE